MHDDMRPVVTLTKVVTVAGQYAADGSQKRFVFGPDSPDQVATDAEIISYLRNYIPNLGHVNSVIDWLTDEESTDTVVIKKAQLTPVAQNKGMR